MVLSEEVQSLVGVLVQVAKVITKMMNTFLPAINQLQRYLISVDDLNLVANSEFSEVCSRRHRVLPHISYVSTVVNIETTGL